MRLIDADALLKRMKRTNRYFNVKFDIDEAPTIDAVPVVHGRWLHNDEYVLWAEKYVCSVCNRNAPSDGDYKHELTDYCPHCGAKMDLEVGGDEP